MSRTPWALTDNFLSAMKEGKGTLALEGPGDPTGRGNGFSYIRESRRVRSFPHSEVLIHVSRICLLMS